MYYVRDTSCSNEVWKVAASAEEAATATDVIEADSDERACEILSERAGFKGIVYAYEAMTSSWRYKASHIQRMEVPKLYVDNTPIEAIYQWVKENGPIRAGSHWSLPDEHKLTDVSTDGRKTTVGSCVTVLTPIHGLIVKNHKYEINEKLYKKLLTEHKNRKTQKKDTDTYSRIMVRIFDAFTDKLRKKPVWNLLRHEYRGPTVEFIPRAIERLRTISSETPAKYVTELEKLTSDKGWKLFTRYHVVKAQKETKGKYYHPYYRDTAISNLKVYLAWLKTECNKAKIRYPKKKAIELLQKITDLYTVHKQKVEKLAQEQQKNHMEQQQTAIA